MEERGMNQSTEIKEVGERTQQERQVQKVGGTWREMLVGRYKHDVGWVIHKWIVV
jgi:hypothetical protein